MNLTNQSVQTRNTNWLLLALFALFLLAWFTPDLTILEGVVLMSLPTHMFAETFSIIVSILVFALIYSSRNDDQKYNLFVLAGAFLIIGLLDFAHTISYPGMPDFVTPGSPDKSIYFWLVARYIAAIGLLITALQLLNVSIRLPNRHWMLFASISLTAFFYWLGLYHLDILPRTFIEGQGLTPFKVWAEYGIIAILLVPAIVFHLQAKKQQPYDAHSLFAATIITILSELCFTLYGNITGLFIFMGHVYKVIAYIYIFKAIFLFVVREPYQKLYQSEQYNRTLFESATIGLALCKTDGTLVDINQAYADIIGRSIEETKGLTYWQITPDDYTSQEEVQLNILGATKHYGPYEKEYLHKDGHRVPVRLTGKLIERDDESLIWSSVEDISEETAAQYARYESEQHLRQLAEHIREVFWLRDIRKNIIIYVSPAYETVWGQSCESLYKDPASFIDAIHHEDRDRVLRAIQRQSQGPYMEEYRIVRSDGSIRWIKEQSFPIQDQNGVTYRIAGITEDITSEKFTQDLLEQRVEERTDSLHKKEAELIAAKEEAERANLAKSQFLSKMSHELRTPLNAILGFSQLLEIDTTLNDNQKDSISEIIHGGNHLLSLINEILDLAKIEHGNYELKRKSVDVRDVLKECISLSTPLRNQYKVSLTVNLDTNNKMNVYADTTRLKQILLNLISNACKYNTKGGLIDIACELTAEHMIRVSIKDTGKGISEANQSHLFEPFNRLNAESSGIEGTGIGLTITKQLIELMGGSIGVKSKIGEGSTFWIELPAYKKD
ncbi:MAG: PAS domain S-box protein [Gammaproteobacteria bacterium]|nr:PAS domain S-box protein [Gammaproteobacteria bacterium]